MDNHTQHMASDHSKHRQDPAQDHSQHDMTEHSMHDMESHNTHSAHDMHKGHAMPAMPTEEKMARMDHSAHAGHGTDHTGHEQMFRVRFWWSLLLFLILNIKNQNQGKFKNIITIVQTETYCGFIRLFGRCIYYLRLRFWC